MTHLPGILYDIADEISRECAYKLAQNWGGVSLYIPRALSLTPTHRLARTLGMDAAIKLCDMYRCEYIDIPLGPCLPPHKKSLIIAISTENPALSNRAIALKAKTTERWVRGVLNAGKDPNQLPLL